jgi:hypothetical protein
MKKTGLSIRLLAIFLLLIFLFPPVIKAVHFFYVPHEYSHSVSSDFPTVKEKHKQCPICKYEFVKIIENKDYHGIRKPGLSSYCYLLQESQLYILPSLYSFNLRAPPLLYSGIA